MKIKSFECPKSIRNLKKKIMLGTSECWSMSHSFQEPSILFLKIVGFLDSNKELNFKLYILGEGPESSLLCLDCAINDDVEAEEHRLYTRYSLY